MEYMKCPTCGGRCKFEYGKGYVCGSCGNIYDSTGTSESAADKLNIANRKRIEDYDFDGALSLCRDVLAEDPDSLEANWCAMLAEYRIIYLKNDENKFVPTFLDPDVETPLYKSDYYKKLNSTYRGMADKIEQMRCLVVDEARDIPDYDVFISYRQHKGGHSDAETEEAEWAEELYKLLSKQTGDDKLRVFFDKESLDKSNVGWEPHIYAALRSAKFLVLMGSSVENINSTWVKNEWKRFIAYRQMGKEKTIAVLAKNIDPLKLPDVALRAGQMIRADEKGWQDKLVKRANDACKENKDVDYLINEADTFICKNKFAKAKQNYMKVCSLAPRDSRGYWGLLRCKLKAFDDYDIIKSKKKLVKINEFNEAMRYASDIEKVYYERIRNAQLTHNTVGCERKNYNEWRRRSKASRFFKKLGAVVVVVAVLAFGAYSYFGITNPIKYSDDGGMVAVGKSPYFDFVVRELDIDLYDSRPVTAIGDGAFKASKIRTLTLGETVERIGEGAFENCTDLTEVHILNEDIEIAAEAFRGCTSLVSVTVGEGEEASVKRAASGMIVGENAFAGCTLLENVTFGRCAAIGANAFDGCIKLKKLKLNVNDADSVDTNAFDGMVKGAEIVLPTIAEDVINSLSAKYTDMVFSTFTRDKIEECIYFINKLENVSDDSGAAIEKAETLYAALSDADKSKISNYGTLRNARASYDVARMIADVGTVTLESGKAIEEAEIAYAMLSVEQKKMVGNYAVIVSARKVFDAVTLIAEIGEVNEESERKIIKAEQAYEELSHSERDEVFNYGALTSARVKVDSLLADIVIEKIKEIAVAISSDSEAAIIEAETAYNSLTAAQKALVTNYDNLVDAHAVCNVIISIEGIGEITSMSESTIATAQALYDALTQTQIVKVPRSILTLLTDAQAVCPVVKSIAEIGIVTSDSLAAMDKAATAFSLLSTSQQAKVSNYSVLIDSREAYATVRLIEGIGEVSEEAYAKIEAAQNSYDRLTASQRELVGNREKLTDASRIYNVIVAINEIGDVKYSTSLEKITAAEKSYANLTSSQKEKVTNSSLLTTARNIYNLMKVLADGKSYTLGTDQTESFYTLTSLNMEEFLNNKSNRDKVVSITVKGFSSLSGRESWTRVFPRITLLRHDISNVSEIPSSFTVPAGFAKVALIGNPARQYDNFSIYFESRNSNCTLELWDMHITAAKGNSIIIATQVSSMFGVDIWFYGDSVLRAGDGSNGTDGTSYDYNKGYKSQMNGANGGNGTDGASAIIGNKIYLTIGSGAKVEIYGGNGGAGGKGGHGGGSDQSGNGQAGHGGLGGRGGNGGAAVYASNDSGIHNFGGTLKLVGGNAGSGNNGGYGGNNTETSALYHADYGGRGGSGGAGGEGGSAFVCGGSFTVNGSGGSEILIGGVGGSGGNGLTGGDSVRLKATPGGGKGGDGGAGGKGGFAVKLDGGNWGGAGRNTTLKGGNGGVGGKGGNGGDCDGGRGGNGGNGGAGGAGAATVSKGPIPSYNGGVGGSGGTAGAKGKNGDSAGVDGAKGKDNEY